MTAPFLSRAELFEIMLALEDRIEKIAAISASEDDNGRLYWAPQLTHLRSALDRIKEARYS